MGLGDTTPEQGSLPPQAMTQNQGGNPFSFVVPTEFVELPSKGKFYGPNHPLHNQETIEVKQLTAKEEDLLTSRALLKKGVALERVISSIIIDKNINANSLLVGDRNAILVSARVSGYGNEYSTKITCPSCAETQPYSFDLNNTFTYNGQDLKDTDASRNEDGTFTTMLPRSKVEVCFRLLKGSDERALLQQVENARKKRKDENAVTRQLKQIVVSVNGSEDQSNVNYVIDNMPSMDARHLRTVYKIATPNIDMTQNFACVECDYEQEMEVPLTADFFWPDR
tara:strand:+ start:473 stop:1318 length:846 start_codon:yes stop_codon:yes gene_type:complete